MMNEVLQKIVTFIKSFEGMSLKSYKDIAGVWTIGIGTTQGVKEGMEITESQAEELCASQADYDRKRLHALTIVPINENQEIALTDFIYNLGGGAYQRSTLRMKLNRGEYQNAANELMKWDTAKGRKITGLTKRRLAEKILFLQ